MFCDEATKIKLSGNVAYCKPLLCRRWSCPECSVTRAAALRFRAKGGNPNIFLTLTVSPEAFNNPVAAAGALVEAWRQIRRRALREGSRDPRRRPKPVGAYAPPARPGGPFGAATRRVELFNGKLPFIAFFETTKAGWPHLHVLVRARWLDQKWLSAQMDELISSPIVDVRSVRSARGVARYLTKYLTKDLKRWGTLKRYYASRDWDQREKPERLPPPLPDVEWRTVHDTWRRTLAMLTARLKWMPKKEGPWWSLKPPEAVSSKLRGQGP